MELRVTPCHPHLPRPCWSSQSTFGVNGSCAAGLRTTRGQPPTAAACLSTVHLPPPCACALHTPSLWHHAPSCWPLAVELNTRASRACLLSKPYGMFEPPASGSLSAGAGAVYQSTVCTSTDLLRPPQRDWLKVAHPPPLLQCPNQCWSPTATWTSCCLCPSGGTFL